MPSSSLSRRHRAARTGGFCVCKVGGYGQLDLRTGIEPNRDSQLAPHKFGPFLHPSQAEVAGASTPTKHLLIDALSVVQDPHPKLPPFMPDFHIDPPRLRVPECIAHRL